MSDEEGTNVQAEREKLRMQAIFRDESAKDKEWKKKYIHGSMYLLGCGEFGSVFQVTTRTYAVDPNSGCTLKSVFDPGFVKLMASFFGVKKEQQEKLRDRSRHDELMDTVAIKYELLDHKLLEDGGTQTRLFLRREYQVMRNIWSRGSREMIGFPLVFDSGYLGNKSEYGINPKFKDIFMVYDIRGIEVNFFEDHENPDIKDVTTISYLTMELLGPSLDDFKSYFEPWYKKAGLGVFFNVRTTFKIADQFLCRLFVLHTCGYVHHDLKLDNIGLGLGRAMNTVYLLDFGFSKRISDTKDLEWMGSRKFMAIDTFERQKPNFAQDVETWFYIFMTLLYDGLPWSEEFIVAKYGADTNETEKWDAVMSIKKTWWSDPNEATSLREMIETIVSIHRAEVNDIGELVHDVYTKVRDLRALLKQTDNARTLMTEINNTQSAIYKGYMTIRGVLLAIFNISGTKNTQLMKDAEIEAIKTRREENGNPTFEWNENDYQWEWDCYHDMMFPEAASDNNADTDAEAAHDDQLFNYNAKLSSFLFNKRNKEQKPDEISYVYNRRTDSLVPKSGSAVLQMPFRMPRIVTG